MTYKVFLSAVVVVVLLSGCSAASRLRSSHGNKYRYTYKLIDPPPASRLSYQDQRIKIQFRLDDAAIRFRLQNLSPAPFKIKWDETSIGVKGRYFAVRNTRTLYTSTHRDNAAPIIPPTGYVIDMAIPSENISYVGSGWKEKDLLPTTDRNSRAMNERILRNKGSRVELVLPIDAGGEIWPYTFRFEVTSVVSLPWERYRTPRRPPQPALPAGSPASAQKEDYIVSAVIVAGVLGVAAVLLTQKKDPPAE
jgi:hypothetical protein